MRWVGELADFNFEIRYRQGKLNVDAESLSQLPSDLISAAQVLSNGDNVWIAALTDKEEELHGDALSQVSGNQVRVVDLVKAQNKDPYIGRVLKLIKAKRKPTVAERHSESP